MMTATEWWLLQLLKLFVSAIVALLIIGGVAAFGHHIAYWAAGLIAVVFVFGGWLIISGDWFDGSGTSWWD